MRPTQLTPENDDASAAFAERADASMRPAQLTPENASTQRSSLGRRRCFNEAGAINAGKLTYLRSGSSGKTALQ